MTEMRANSNNGDGDSSNLLGRGQIEFRRFRTVLITGMVDNSNAVEAGHSSIGDRIQSNAGDTGQIR